VATVTGLDAFRTFADGASRQFVLNSAAWDDGTGTVLMGWVTFGARGEVQIPVFVPRGFFETLPSY